MAPLLPARLHPFATQLQNLIKAPHQSTPGEIDQIVFERSLDERTRDNVLDHFARDVDLLQYVGGDVNQLGAMGSPGLNPSGELSAYNNLAVQMAGQHGRIVRWSISPAQELVGARLTVSGSAGRATVSMPPEPDPWRLEIKFQGESKVFESADWNPHAASLDELRAAIRMRQPSRWPDAARAIELAETIDRSLAKGRTINLHQQEFSDVSTFKGLMTSVGCALLIGSLLVAVAAVVVANFLKHAGAGQAARLVGAVPYVIVVLMGLFLAMQLLLKLAQKSESPPPGQDNLKGKATVKPDD
jgi:myo-inositol 2-dehydrogenase/D-chiro-inositol 1-dehydrogenase